MNSTVCARLLSIVLLSCLSLGGAGVAQAQEVPAASAGKTTAAAPKKAATAKKAETVKKAAPKKAAPKKAAPAKKRAAAGQSKTASDVTNTRLPSTRLDLSLPQDLVNKMQPVGKVPLSKSRPLLPQMFVEKPASQTPFQLNGRLLSNEMELQLRNDSRRDVEGAALDFEFKQ